jgi:hypothetical protein
MITLIGVSRLTAMKGTYRVMKNKVRNLNITKNRMRVALLFVSATSIIGLAPAFSTIARASTAYSVNDVSGIYVELGAGFTYGVGGPNNLQSAVPGSEVSLTTFTPATSTFHRHAILRVNGDTIAVDFDGSYTVDPDGHGTMSWLSRQGGAKQIDFYIVNGGTELKWIDTDPPGTAVLSVSGTMTKQ